MTKQLTKVHSWYGSYIFDVSKATALSLQTQDVSRIAEN